MAQSAARNSLPLLQVGQAQKEVTHNEALIIIDALLQPTVEAEQSNPPSGLDETDAGNCWIVGNAATGVWAGKESSIGYWTGESWRFATIHEGTSIFRKDIAAYVVRSGLGWHDPSPIPSPTGGTAIDAEARATIDMILGELKFRRIIPV